MIPFQVQSFSYPYQYQVQIQSSSSCSSLYQPNYYVGYMNPSIPIDYDIPPETSADNGPEKKFTILYLCQISLLAVIIKFF